MLVGSQLKNAQIEVVLNAVARDALLDPVVGRIVYVRSLGQLFIYDDGTPSDSSAGWKPIYTKEDADAADVVVNAARIAGDNSVEAAFAAADTAITNGTTDLFSNRKVPQEMTHTWNLMGRFGGSGTQSFIDGVLTLPFDCEVTGISAHIANNGTSSYTTFNILKRDAIGGTWTGILDTVGKFTAGDDTDQAMYINNVVAATGAWQEAAVSSAKTDTSGADVLPDLDATAGVLTEAMQIGVDIVASAPSAKDISVTVFFRRKNNG